MLKEDRFYLDIMEMPSEVTGSFKLVILKIGEKTIKYAIDCGLFLEKERDEENFQFPINPKELDFVILTHNHTDHCGRLPYLVRQGFRGKVYCSKITQKILNIALADTVKIFSDTAKRRNTEPLYDQFDVHQLMSQVEGVDYLRPISINENVEATFLYNGHLIGAASVLLRNRKGNRVINLFETGDYNSENYFFNVPPIRKWITDLPVTIIQESTYGYMNTSEISYCFEENVLETIKKHGTVIIPVFSLGRCQEIMSIIKEMQNTNELMKNIPVYLDGNLAIRYNKVYSRLIESETLHVYDSKKDFYPENFHVISDYEERNSLLHDYSSCKIILTTSGMGSYGPAQMYIPAYIGKKNALIHFTGYCAEGTLGYYLKNASEGDIVDVAGLKEIKKANVQFTNEFSAHAKADTMINFLKQFNDLHLVLVNHGEDKVKDSFANRILREVKPDNIGILGREYFYRIDDKGLVKTLSTKFK